MSIQPSCLCIFGLNLYDISQIHIITRSMHGKVGLCLFLFLSSSDSFAFWFDPNVYLSETAYFSSTRMLVFLLGCVTSTLYWNISSAVFILFQNSMILLILLVDESNTLMSICLCHSQGSMNSTIFMVLLSGIPWFVPNVGKLLRYLEIYITWHMNSWVLEYRLLNKTQFRHLFCH